MAALFVLFLLLVNRVHLCAIMKLDRYELRSGQSSSTFEFVSIGPKGSILKTIQFSKLGYDNIYNLAFGDKVAESDEMDDLIVTNNNDSEKVLTTVFAAILRFTEANPTVWIYAIGSSKSRTRLYRMGINKYFEEIENDLYIFGLKEMGWEKFIRGNAYIAFAALRK